MNVDVSGSARVWLHGSEVTEEDVCQFSRRLRLCHLLHPLWRMCSVSDGCFSDGLSLSWLDALTRKTKGWKLRTSVSFIYAKANLPTDRVLSREFIALASSHRFKVNYWTSVTPAAITLLNTNPMTVHGWCVVWWPSAENTLRFLLTYCLELFYKPNISTHFLFSAWLLVFFCEHELPF